MARMSSILFLLVSAAISTIRAAPVADMQSRQEAATVNFIPYAGPCEMSTNPFDHTPPANYNITTSSGCITPPYAFTSYVEEANAIAATGPCALSIFSGPDCTGSASTAVLTTFYECNFASGQSVQFACGP